MTSKKQGKKENHSDFLSKITPEKKSIGQFFQKFHRFFLAGGLAIFVGIGSLFLLPAPYILATENFFSSRNISENGHFEITFSQIMHRKSAQKAVHLSPAIEGDFSWKDGNTLVFSPSKNLKKGEEITLLVDADAKSIFGKSIGKTVEIRYSVVGSPAIAMISPISPEDWGNVLSLREGNGAKKIPEEIPLLKKGQKITILFDRPMRALGEEKDISALVHFSPEMTGGWRWVGTSAAQFLPNEADFLFSRTLTAKILPGISAIDGGTTTEEISWKMRTPAPEIERILIGDREIANEDWANLDFPRNQNVFFEWNQPIDLESFFQHFEITPKRGVHDDIIALDPENPNRVQIQLSPPLEAGTDFVISVLEGVKPLQGDFISEKIVTRSFRTISPACFRLSEEKIFPASTVFLDFCTPTEDAEKRSDFLKNHLVLSPKPEDFSVECPLRSNTCGISFSKKAGESYQMSLDADLIDDFGQNIPQEKVAFSVDPFPPSFSVMSRYFSSTSVFDRSEPFGLFVSLRDISEAQIVACGVSQEEFRHQQNTWQTEPKDICGEDRLVKWSESFAPTNNEISVVEIPFDTHFQEMPEVIFWKIYTAEAPEEWQKNHYGSALFADGNIVLKSGDDFAEVWVTDFVKGAPVSNISVKFFDQQNAVFAEGKTDENGFLRVQKPKETFDFFAEVEEEDFVAFSGSDWIDGIAPWDFGVSANFWSSFHGRGVVFSDRPIYRPGDTVHLKGIFRGENLSLPQNAEVRLEIQDSQSKEIFSQNFPLDEWGTLSFDLPTKSEFATGNYFVSAFWNDEWTAQYSFWIEEYKPASFRVELKPTQEIFFDGENLSANLSANYFFGMPVANAEIEWSAIATPLSFDKFSGEGWFSFGTGNCFWFCDESEEVLGSGSGTADENGNLAISLPLAVEENKLLTLRATAKNKNSEFVSGFTTLPLFVGDFVIGVRPEKSWLDESDKKLKISAVASAPDGTPLADKKMEALLQKVVWNSVQKKGIDGEYYWESEKELQEIAQKTESTKIGGKAEIEFDLPLDNPLFFGELQVTVRSAENPKISTSDFLWRSSNTYGASFVENNTDRISLRFDKNEYKPGEIAKMVPEISFPEKKWAMLSIQQEDVLSRKFFEWDGSSLEIPITENMMPNAFVELIFLSGKGIVGDHFSEVVEFQNLVTEKENRKTEKTALEKKQKEISKTRENTDEKTAEILKKGLENTAEEIQKITDLEAEELLKEEVIRQKLISVFGENIPKVGTIPPYPEMKMGIKSIAVSAEEKRLGIEIKTEKAEYLPGETVRFEVHAQKSGGFPAENADISLAVVDESVLALKSRENEDIFASFFAPHELAVRTAALLTKFSHRLNVRSAGGAKGGGGGLDLELLQKKRGEFRDTAFWTARLTTDERGIARGEFTLPDNITSWQIWSTANTKDSFFGSEKKNFLSRKPLIIRPVLPRFLVVGDQAKVGFSVHNNFSEKLIVKADFSAKNVEISGQTESTFSLEKGEEKTLFFPISALGKEETALGELVPAQFSLSVQGDVAVAVDSVEYQVPILAPVIKSSLATSGFLGEKDEQISEKILFPGGALENLGGMFFSATPNVIGNITDGLLALARYPYGCAEQIMSSHLPNVALLLLATKSPENFPDFDATETRKKVADGIAKLLPLQREDGGFGFWADSSESYPYLTAYVLFGLLETRDAEFEIPDEVFSAGSNYLRSILIFGENPNLGQIDSYGRMIDDDGRAFALLVLSKIDSQNLEMDFEDLFSHREKLSAEGMAFLMQSARILGKTESEKVLKNELIAMANIEARSAFFTGNDFAWNFSSDIRATAIALSSLLMTDADIPLLPQMLTYLRDQKRGYADSWGGPWGTTQNTAWVIFALIDWISVHPSDASQVSATLNLEEIFSEDFAKGETAARQIFVPRSEMRGQNDLDIHKKGSALSYEILENSYYSVQDFPEKNEGFYIVSDFFDRTDTDEKNPLSSAKKGDLLRGKIVIMTDRDRHFVGGEIPLPAGLEGVNFTLETEDASLQKEIQKCEWIWCETGSWYFSHTEFRDDRVFLFADYLPAGTHEFRFFARATTAGDFSWRPSRAEEIYHPEIFGNTAGRKFVIED